MVAAVVGGLAWCYWLAVVDPAINYLTREPPADWIVYPRTFSLRPRRGEELVARFECGFKLAEAPAKGTIKVCGCRQYRLWVNERLVAQSADNSNWKVAAEYDSAAFFVVGDNRVVVDVTNRQGPPALWLSLAADGNTLASDDSWEVTLGNGYRRRARFAAQADPPLANAARQPRPIAAIVARWPMLVILLLVAAGIVVGAESYFRSGEAAFEFDTGRRGKRCAAEPGAAASDRVPLVLIGVAAAMWIALVWNNMAWLFPRTGFDVVRHIEYVDYLLKYHRLPLANEGWQMYQPPLYYVAAASAVAATGRAAVGDDGVTAIRAVNLVGALVQVTFLYLSLRLLCRDDRRRQLVGWLLAAFLPAQLMLFQYVSNEGWAAALSAVALYLALRLMQDERASWRLAAVLGASLGAALLTKFSTLIVVAIVYAVLGGQLLVARERRAVAWATRLGLPMAVLCGIAGWHYVRVWMQFGNPFIGNWDPASGYVWWQDPGYHEMGYFWRLGRALTQPAFSATNGLGDALYSTFWGDGLCGGASDYAARPPWNQELLAIGYLLAAAPATLILVGASVYVVRLVREPRPERFLIALLAGGMSLAVVTMVLRLPYMAQAKSFYALPVALAPCVFLAEGWAAVAARAKMLSNALLVVLVLWAVNSYAAIWIAGDSADVQRATGYGLMAEGRLAEAYEHFRRACELEPENPELPAAVTQAAGMLLTGQGRHLQAIEQLRQAVSLRPDVPELANNLAWLLATEGTLGRASGSEAVRVSKQACELTAGQDFAYLDTLGAAYAAAGQFHEALQTAEQAHDLAIARGQQQAVREIQQHIERYRQNRDLREPIAGDAGS